MFDFLYNPQGRISRKGYFLAYFLPYLALAQILPSIIHGGVFSLIFGLISLFYFWPSLVAVPVKRFHDLGVTGWYQLGVVALSILAGLIVVQGIRPLVGEEIANLPVAEQQRVMMEAIMQSGRAKLGLGLAFIVNLAVFVLFVAVKGQTGSNRYGDDPLESGRGFAD